jgi:hypothetical protein
MIKQMLSAAAIVGALASATAFPSQATTTDPTPSPYCAGDDPGDLLNGVTCQEQVNPSSVGETPDPRPSSPPPGDNLPGGGNGGGPGGPGGNGGGSGGNGPR